MILSFTNWERQAELAKARVTEGTTSQHEPNEKTGKNWHLVLWLFSDQFLISFCSKHADLISLLALLSRQQSTISNDEKTGNSSYLITYVSGQILAFISFLNEFINVQILKKDVYYFYFILSLAQ